MASTAWAVSESEFWISAVVSQRRFDTAWMDSDREVSCSSPLAAPSARSRRRSSTWPPSSAARSRPWPSRCSSSDETLSMDACSPENCPRRPSRSARDSATFTCIVFRYPLIGARILSMISVTLELCSSMRSSVCCRSSRTTLCMSFMCTSTCLDTDCKRVSVPLSMFSRCCEVLPTISSTFSRTICTPLSSSTPACASFTAEPRSLMAPACCSTIWISFRKSSRMELLALVTASMLLCKSCCCCSITSLKWSQLSKALPKWLSCASTAPPRACNVSRLMVPSRFSARLPPTQPGLTVLVLTVGASASSLT
mmetsp:Transcript_117908/g.334337  ORF Transcript_117908/g.334337 Transcript_117908/m.334337 type:complete len:311 (-) Transcript_117908:428-1360(-)